jgi:hypothetical protein
MREFHCRSWQILSLEGDMQRTNSLGFAVIALSASVGIGFASARGHAVQSLYQGSGCRARL